MKVPNLRKISLAIAGVFLLSLSFSQAGEVVINNFDDPTEAKRALDRVTTRKKDAAGRPCAAFNPMARQDSDLFRTVINGEHSLKGFEEKWHLYKVKEPI